MLVFTSTDLAHLGAWKAGPSRGLLQQMLPHGKQLLESLNTTLCSRNLKEIMCSPDHAMMPWTDLCIQAAVTRSLCRTII